MCIWWKGDCTQKYSSLERLGEGVRSPGARVTECELPAMGYWNLNSSPLEVQHSDRNHQDIMPAPQNE